MNRFQRCYPQGMNDRRPCPGEAPCSPNEQPIPAGLPLALSYVPPQPFENLLVPEEGFREGSIFADLIKPYEGGCRS